MSEKRFFRADDDALGVVDRKGGLGDVGDRRARRNVQRGHVGLVLHQGHRRADLAHGAFHFGMAGMADQDQGAAMGDITLALIVDLGNQRAGGVQNGKTAGLPRS